MAHSYANHILAQNQRTHTHIVRLYGHVHCVMCAESIRKRQVDPFSVCAVEWNGRDECVSWFFVSHAFTPLMEDVQVWIHGLRMRAHVFFV